MFYTSISVGSFKYIRYAVVCRTFCLGVNNSTFLCKIIVLYICCTNLPLGNKFLETNYGFKRLLFG
jgi:hypothetical protein